MVCSPVPLGVCRGRGIVTVGHAGASRRDVLKIVLTYGVISALWIVLSDQVLEWMVADPAQYILASVIKGWLFVAVTAVLLYGLVWRLVSRIAQSREARLQTLNLLATIADSSDDAIFAKDREGRYLLFNRAASRFVGKSDQEVLGQDDRGIFPPEQADFLIAVGRRVMDRGVTETNEEILDTAEGPRVFSATKGPLRDGDGTVVGIFGISRDITEAKRGEDALRERDLMLNAIIGHSPSALSLKRPDGRYVVANPEVQKLLQRNEAEILGKTDFDLMPAQTAGILGANEARVVGSRAYLCVEETVPLEGQSRVFMSHIFPVLAKDGSLRYICRISLEITGRKEAEAAQAVRSAELERFNRAMVGRELVMMELKRQVNGLAQELGRAPPFVLPDPALDEPPRPGAGS